MIAAWVDGRFVEETPDLAPARGLFETLGADAGALPLWDRHLARLEDSARALGMPCAPPPQLRARARELLAHTGHRDGVLRITLSAEGEKGTWSLTARARRASAAPLRLCIVRTTRPAGDRSAAHKSTARALYDDALSRARAAGADDALLVAEDGAVLETTTANVIVVGAKWLATPPLDGRVLPGIARALLRARAAAHGVPIAERVLTAQDLDTAAIWVTNAVHGPRPAMVPGQAPPAGATLPALWAEVLAAHA